MFFWQWLVKPPVSLLHYGRHRLELPRRNHKISGSIQGGHNVVFWKSAAGILNPRTNIDG